MTLNQQWLLSAACAVVLALLPADLAAQRRDSVSVPADPRMAQFGLSTAEVLVRLRESGMTRQQVRAELQRRGYDPALADPYFDILEQEAERRGSGTFLDALGRAGLAGRDTSAAGSARDASAGRARSAADLDLEAILSVTDDYAASTGTLPVFGVSFFRRGAGMLEDTEYGPVDAGYRLGAGDEINLVLTGAVQDAYVLRVSREGTLVVPEVGELAVNGLTLAGLEDVLRRRLAEVYASGLTRVSVSLGRVRSIQVYVVGDVERPGAYPVSGLSTVLSALYRAGGPSATGSFRQIELRRRNQLVQRLDLYDYLLHGNSQADARLQHDDVLFIPPVGRRVRMEGAVKRPAIYELVDGDGLRDAIRFAGGPEADASLRRVQVDRIVPPAQRTPGVEREVVDVDVVRLLSPDEPDLPLRDGDRVHVFSVAEERRNLVTIVGEVRRPGTYAWAPGTTLGDVVDRAAGMTEGAYTGRAHVFRMDPATGTRTLVSTPLAADMYAVVLAERDSVVVYNRNELRPVEYVTVGGLVQRPGRYPLHEGATLNDIILTAGGYAEGAHQLEAYVARPNLATERTDATAQSYSVALAGAPGSDARTGPPAWAAGAAEFVLQPGDRIEIRRAPGYEPPRTVVITGEVVLPGTYVLESRADRVSRLLGAAGGLTPEAHASGLHVVRGGRTLAADAAGGAVRAGSAEDVVLQEGDTVRVPRFDPTVLVHGAVVHDSTRVLYRDGMSVQDLVREAGGFTRSADRSRLTVTYQNGQRGLVRRQVLLPDRQPAPEPGSTIYVPERPAGARDGVNWGTLISQLIAAAGAVATLIIALNQSGT